MVVRNKLYRVIETYRALLKSKHNKAPHKLTLKSNKSKNQILDFYLKHGRFPYKKAKNKTERILGLRFENFVSKVSRSYDPHFRRLAFSTGLRNTNLKRRHNVKEFKQEILQFVKEHKRVPSPSYQYETIEGEARLRNKLDYYTKECNDMTLLGQVYKVDKCHRSGIAGKFRRTINEALKINKPLVRVV